MKLTKENKVKEIVFIVGFLHLYCSDMVKIKKKRQKKIKKTL